MEGLATIYRDPDRVSLVQLMTTHYRDQQGNPRWVQQVRRNSAIYRRGRLRVVMGTPISTFSQKLRWQDVLSVPSELAPHVTEALRDWGFCAPWTDDHHNLMGALHPGAVELLRSSGRERPFDQWELGPHSKLYRRPSYVECLAEMGIKTTAARRIALRVMSDQHSDLGVLAGTSRLLSGLLDPNEFQRAL